MLEEGKGPQLKREVINKKKEPSKKKSASKKSHSKTGMYIALGVVGVLLVSLLIFGGMKLMTGGLSSSDEKTSEVQKKNYQELLDFADKAKEKAYAPYSRFQVGAAILTKEGKVFTGCSVENSSYGAAICAERTAAVKAVSEGYHDFEMIAIASEYERSTLVTGWLLRMGTPAGLDDRRSTRGPQNQGPLHSRQACGDYNGLPAFRFGRQPVQPESGAASWFRDCGGGGMPIVRGEQ